MHKAGSSSSSAAAVLVGCLAVLVVREGWRLLHFVKWLMLQVGGCRMDGLSALRCVIT